MEKVELVCPKGHESIGIPGEECTHRTWIKRRCGKKTKPYNKVEIQKRRGDIAYNQKRIFHKRSAYK